MSLRDLALLTAIKAYAAGKRWRVACATCGWARIVDDVNDLGRALLAHGHDGNVNLTISAVK